jgi:hypothetical protein
MSKAVQAFLSGVFFTFILDFFLFLGIKENYIDKLEIDLYYNILFADNQNVFIFFFFSILLGYITLYLSNKISLMVVGALFILAVATLIPPIGFSIGEAMLMEKNQTLYTEKFLYRGDIYYNGRKSIDFYDYKLDKRLKLNKNKIKERH